MDDDGRRDRIRSVIGAARPKRSPKKPIIQVTGDHNVIIVNPTPEQLERFGWIVEATPLKKNHD